MEQHNNKLESHAYHVWTKRRAKEKLICWATHAIINKGDLYYEYVIDLKLYGQQIDMANPVVTEAEYFKQALKGFPGFNYYDDKKNN
jgi:hypothetical protein